MATLAPSDYVFATASVHGVEFFNFAGEGIADMSTLIQKVRHHADCVGMVTLNVRNTSRGWSQSRNFYLA